jgi:hypothetical protein
VSSLRKKILLVPFVLSLLIAISSASQVNEATGPFRISFDTPIIGEPTIDVPDPLPSSTLTMYAVTVSGDKWFMNMVITDYNEPQEIDINNDRLLTKSSVGDGAELMDRVVDGRAAIMAMKSGSGGTSSDIIYRLDERKKVDLTLASDLTGAEFMAGLDTILNSLKITY